MSSQNVVIYMVNCFIQNMYALNKKAPARDILEIWLVELLSKVIVNRVL